MKNCKFCGEPLTEKGIRKGRTEHFGCRMLKKTIKKSKTVLELDSTDFNIACKTLDRKPGLLNRLFSNQ